MSGSLPRRVALLACALAASAGCSTGGALQLSELPASPVAVLYRNESAATKHAGAMKDLEERQQGGGGHGLVRLEDLDALFGGVPDAAKRVAEPGHLALIDPHTGRATEVVDNVPPGAHPLGWSPDRKTLLLAGRWRDGTQLFAWDRAAGTVQILTSGPYEHPQGCLLADGRLVALEIDASGGKKISRLVATPKGGTGVRPLTEGPSEAQPACSPTEDQIANVTIGSDGVPVIVVRTLDAPQWPHLAARGFNPTFTPDGKWILFAAKTQQGKRVFRVRPDGSGRSAVSQSTQEESEPAVSPDGRYVAYVVEQDHRDKLWVRRIDLTGGDRPLLGDGDGVSPVW